MPKFGRQIGLLTNNNRAWRENTSLLGQKNNINYKPENKGVDSFIIRKDKRKEQPKLTIKA